MTRLALLAAVAALIVWWRRSLSRADEAGAPDDDIDWMSEWRPVTGATWEPTLRLWQRQTGGR